MKILFYINAIHHGGAERVLVNLTRYFSDENECILVTSFKDKWEYSVGKEVKRVILCDKIESSFFKRNLILTKKLRQIMVAEKPDIIISFMAEPNFRSIIAAFGLGIPTIISVRNDPNMEYPNFIFRMAAKVLYPLAKGVVFQTEDARQWFSKRIQKKSRIIYNPVDESFYREQYSGERKDIVTTGRLTTQKNHILLINAFNQIHKTINDNLIIYGDGELKNEIEAHVHKLGLEDRVFLPGATKDVVDSIKAAKVFVLSSDYEGMPNSLMEAMALGVPCISTDCPCGGPRMLLKNNYLVPVGDKSALADEILRLLDPQEQKKAELYCRDCSSVFESHKIYEKWREYLWEVAK